VVASENDPFDAFERAAEFAHAWGAAKFVSGVTPAGDRHQIGFNPAMVAVGRRGERWRRRCERWQDWWVGWRWQSWRRVE
jgi:hypothetical protein